MLWKHLLFLETGDKIISRHLDRMYISSSSTYYESAVKATLVKRMLCKQFHLSFQVRSACGLNQWIFVNSVLLGLHKWKLGEYLLIYIFKITLDFGLSDKASLMRSARSGWIFNAKPSIHESWVHLLLEILSNREKVYIL